MNEFSAQRQSGASRKTSRKFSKRNGCGHMSAESACAFVISDVSTTKTTGATKAMRGGDQEAVVGDRDEQPPPANRARHRAGDGAGSAWATAVIGAIPW